MNSAGQLPRMPSLRRRNRPQQETSTRSLSRGVSSLRAGLRNIHIFQTMDDTEEVALWLRTIGLEQYESVFRDKAVTGNTLLSLNSVELRKTLGVTNLSDRRQILDAISYLAQTLSIETKTAIPEDGRILTHLSNERIFLVWVRFTVLLHTVALVTLRLGNLENGENTSRIQLVSFFLSVLAIFAFLYGTHRYYRMHCMIDNPGEEHAPDKIQFVAPVLIVASSVIVAIYALMSNSTEEAAALALLAI